MATINCTLNSFVTPGFSGYEPDFGSKKPNGEPVTSREAANNIAMPFRRERPFVVNENSDTTVIEANSVFEIATKEISLTLGNGKFTGCLVRVINTSDGNVTVIFSGRVKMLKPGESLMLEYGTEWIMPSFTSSVNSQLELAQYKFTNQSVIVHAQGNIDIAVGGILTVDGVLTGAGDIVLLTKQTDAKENGLYMVQVGSWIRLSGYEAANDQAFDYKYIYVRSGAVDAGKIFIIGTESYVIGETEIEFFESAFSFASIPEKIVIRDTEGDFAGSGGGGGGGPVTPMLTGIYVDTLPSKTSYEQNEAFDPNGLVVKAIFSDDSMQVVYPENPPNDGTSGYILSVPNMAAIGSPTVTVTYRGFTVTFGITVSTPPPPPVITGITLTSQPAKLTYEIGETLDFSGMVVKAVYSNGSQTTLSYHSGGTTGWKNSSPDMSTAGTKSVTISYTPDATTFTQTFQIEVTLGANYDGAVDNVTETNNNLLTILSAANVQAAWQMLHERINADGLANYHGLGLGDYMDITAGLPAPLSIAWNATYINLRMYILGFNTYKGSRGNTKNHILWGFKNIPTTRAMHSSNDNSGGYYAKDLRTYVEGDFLTSLIAALGADYFYNVSRLISTKGGSRDLTAKIWLPNEKEVFGSANYGDDPDPQIPIPMYTKDAAHRVKNWNGSASGWWEGSPHSSGTTAFCLVTNGGNAISYNASNTIGVAPCFCQI